MAVLLVNLLMHMIINIFESEGKQMYYLENYFTNEIVDVYDNVNDAIEKCKLIEDTIVTDENNHVFYVNVELPF